MKCLRAPMNAPSQRTRTILAVTGLALANLSIGLLPYEGRPYVALVFAFAAWMAVVRATSGR